jgi:hypothetical protein
MMTNSEKALGYICTHCRNIGAFHGDGAPYKFLAEVACEIDAAEHTELFPERYKEHVAFALETVARHHFLEPPAAVASVYLVTRFEFFFRILSGKLKADGTWLDKAADRPAAITALKSSKGMTGNRVSDVAVTYKLMKLDKSRPAARLFERLDREVLPNPTTVAGNFEVADIGDRIAFGRHSVGHGLRGDLSSEGVFYGLVTAIVFYSQF